MLTQEFPVVASLLPIVERLLRYSATHGLSAGQLAGRLPTSPQLGPRLGPNTALFGRLGTQVTLIEGAVQHPKYQRLQADYLRPEIY